MSTPSFEPGHAAYDAIADWYDRFVRENVFMSAEQVIAASGLDSEGLFPQKRVCDLACGQGHLARRLAVLGASVTGVDISRGLLDFAVKEEFENPQGIVYVHGDAQDLPTLGGEPFDYVFCNLALMDMQDLDAVLVGISRILRLGGGFVAAITHPCFQYPRSLGYLTEGFWRSENRHGVRGQVGAYHRTLGTYLTAFGNAGLPVDRAVEVDLPAYVVPPALVIRCINCGR